VTKGEDFDFYRHTYGALDVMTSGDNVHETVMYYRIYKNGNDYLRYLLYNFASHQDAQAKANPNSKAKDTRTATNYNINKGAKATAKANRAASAAAAGAASKAIAAAKATAAAAAAVPFTQILYCAPDDCTHPRVQKVSGANLKNVFYSPKAQRFPFTFVRHPVLRFVSAVKEVGGCVGRMEERKERREREKGGEKEKRK
jgi:hypothetical protein